MNNVPKIIEFRTLIKIHIDFNHQVIVKKLLKKKKLKITLLNLFKILRERKIISIKNNKNKQKWLNVAPINSLQLKLKKSVSIINNSVSNKILSTSNLGSYHKILQ